MKPKRLALKGLAMLLRLATRLPPHRRQCPICKTQVNAFLPHLKWRSQPRLIIAANCIGSDLSNYLCPICHAHDRERHLYLYMRETGLLEHCKGKDILHFAPEKCLSPILKAVGPKTYLKGDLFPSSADIQKIDMQEIPYPDETFDLIVANHVLEHVVDDLKAVREVRRVLKKSGVAILQTPFSAILHHTICDPGFNDNIRVELCGQADHLRLYGKDIFARFESGGLESRVKNHAEALAGFNPRIYGVNGKEPFFLFGRQ